MNYCSIKTQILTNTLVGSLRFLSIRVFLVDILTNRISDIENTRHFLGRHTYRPDKAVILPEFIEENITGEI